MALLDVLQTYLRNLESQIAEKTAAFEAEIAPLRAEVRQTERAISALHTHETPWTASEVRLPHPQAEFASLTMKELTVRALRERFPNGATAQELLEFFATEWGRPDIVRSSYSPQLSRLKADKVVRLDGRKWFLVSEAEKNEAPTEAHPEGASSDGESGISPDNRQTSLLQDLG